MARDYEELQQKNLELDLTGIPRSEIQSAKDAVGSFVVDAILTRVADGTSPVTGRKFKELSKNYADKMKGGDRNPNLELFGDMLNSLGYKPTKEGIAVGIMSEDQRPKADGHNNLSGKSSLPQRRFIPATDENFVPSIRSEIDKILDEFRASAEPEIVEREADDGGISVTLANVLEDENLISILTRRLRG